MCGRTIDIILMIKRPNDVAKCEMYDANYMYERKTASVKAGMNTLTILEINENATLVFSISFKHELVHHHFVFIGQLHFTYSIKWSVFVFIGYQCALYKSTCYKTIYLTLCNVPHEWFEFLHRVILADWVDQIFPTSKCRYVFFISKYLKAKSLKIVIILELVAAVSFNVVSCPVYEPLLHFVCTWHWYKN